MSKKIAVILAGLLLASPVFADNDKEYAHEVKFLNANNPNTTMLVTYGICNEDRCYPEQTTSVDGGSFSGVSINTKSTSLLVTKVVETENNQEIARTEDKRGLCRAKFSRNATLVFNNYGTKSIVCSVGYSIN